MNARDLLDALPDDALLPVRVVREILAEQADEREADGPDYTVAEAGRVLARSASCVRSWCSSGAIDAYRLRGREWRVPRAAIRELQDRERASARGSGRPANLAAWRRTRTG